MLTFLASVALVAFVGWCLFCSGSRPGSGRKDRW